MEINGRVGTDVDLIIEELNFGKFQIIALSIISAVILIDVISTGLYVFTAIESEYRCRISECEDSGAVYNTSWVNEAMPLNSRTELEKCSRFAVNDAWNSSVANNCSMLEFNKSAIVGCEDWVYGNGDTLISEFDLACQKWKAPFIGTIHGVGSLISLSYVGMLSDKFGRKYIMAYSLFARGLIGLIQALAPGYWSYTILDFLITALTTGSYSAAYILCAELLSSKHRVMGTLSISLSVPVAMIAQGFIAMWIPYWRTLLCVVFAPAVLFIFCMPAIPESIRWLITRQRYSDAIALIEKAARYNNVHFTENALKQIESLRLETATQDIKANVEKVTFAAIFRSRRLTLRLVVCAFCWMTNVLVYYALSINSVTISSDNKYFNYILVAATEIVSVVVYCFTADRFGRKPCLSGSLVLCGIVCGAYAFTPADMKTLALVFYLASKLFISFSFNLIYIYTSELFPTSLRHTCLGACSMVGRVGNILAPQTALMSEWHSSLPMSLFALIAFSSGISTLIFPETLNTKFPETIAEAELITHTKRSKA